MQEKTPSKVKDVFWVVSTCFQVNLKVTQNLKKSHEVGSYSNSGSYSTRSTCFLGEPTFWII